MDGVGSFEVEIKQPSGARNFELLPRFQDGSVDLIRLGDVIGDGAVVLADYFQDLLLPALP